MATTGNRSEKSSINLIGSKKTTINDIVNLIKKWARENNGAVSHFATFAELDLNKLKHKEKYKQTEILKDTGVTYYGQREALKVLLEGFKKEISRSREDFLIK